MNVRLILSSSDAGLVDKSVTDLLDVLRKLDANVIGPIPLPTGFSSFKPFDGNVTHRRLMDIEKPTTELLSALHDFNMPIGVDVKMRYS